MNSVKVSLFALMMALVVPATGICGEPVSHEAAQVGFEVPDGWTWEADEDTITLTAPDEGMAVVFGILEQDGISEALQIIDASVEEAIGTVDWDDDGQANEGELNGMPSLDWHGTAQEETLGVSVLAIATPGEKALCVYWFSTAESEEAFDDDIQALLDSIQPLEGE